MSVIQNTLLYRLVHSVSHGVTAFFKHDLKLKRAEDGVRIVLQERPAQAKARAPTRQEKVAQRDNHELELMRVELAALLNELPGTRDTMRHLVFVEQALAKKGLRSLHRLPLDVLQRALEQLEGLVTNWAPVGLASLRSKMAVCILDREHMDPEAEADAYRTAAVLDSTPPPTRAEPVPERSDDEALAAAYAALGQLAPLAEPAAVVTQGELGSRSARVLQREAQRPTFRDSAPSDSLKLRSELQAS
jgi:hypothetical protein